jgi:cation diffusion facilitator CzcD-associated flavoprotein CzcO
MLPRHLFPTARPVSFVKHKTRERHQVTASTATSPAIDYDAIVIGAGLSGMYQLYRLRELGMRVRVFEAGTNVGGTWYWNRYPGARFDSESYSYGYSFSRELLEEWEWSEHFAGQPETLRYCNYVADKFDLRRDIQFRSRVTAAIYEEATRSWSIMLEDGSHFRSRFLITAIGPLSTPTLPRIAGRDTFEGKSFHTARWPHEPVDFVGKRVAVIGTGATGVQTIQTIAAEVGHLTVFQRTPNWCAPLHNGKIDADTQSKIKAGYPEMFRRCQETFACFIHTPDPRGAFEVSDAEREAFYEKLYSERGFGIWQGNFRDILIDRKANATISEFVARKIRERVKDQEVAEKLIPKNHGFGTRRLPLETFYYEVYNRDNMMMLMGPHTALGNIPRSIEYSVDWVTGLIRFARANGLTRLEATSAGVESWTDHVKALGVGLLSNEVNSWMTGINSNVEGKQTRIVARYSGSAPAYRERCDAVAANGYQELALS